MAVETDTEARVNEERSVEAPASGDREREILFAPLLDVLDAQSALFGELLDVLDTERQALVDADPAALNETTKEKETLLARMKALEQERLGTVEDLAAAFSVQDPRPDLADLVKRAPRACAASLSERQRRLSGQVAAIEEANRSNGRLLNHGLALIRGSIRLLDQLCAPHSIYQRSGQVSSGQGSGRMFSGRV